MTMTIFDVLQLTGGLILALGYIPQIQKIWKTKSAADFNLGTFVLLFIGIGLMEIYAVSLVLSGAGAMYLLTNTMALLIAAVMVLLIAKYQRK